MVGIRCCTNAPVDEIEGHSILVNFLNIIVRYNGTVSPRQEDLSRVFLGV